jgi:hypothetical protein
LFKEIIVSNRVKCDKCGKPFYVNRVKRLAGNLLCNSCFKERAERWRTGSPEAFHTFKLHIESQYNKYLTEIDFTPPDIFKNMDFKAAYQNDEKLDSRELISEWVRKTFTGPTRPECPPLTFMEFLGAGHGALYYGSHLPIKRMLLVEKDQEAFDNFYRTSYKEFCRRLPNMGVDLFNADILDHMRNHNAFTWNVVNLDFCTYCWEYKDGGDGSSISVVEEFLRSNTIEQKSFALITSFQVKGRNLRIGEQQDNKNVYPDEESITIALQRVAAKYGLTLIKTLSNTYEPNNKTTMLNLGFVVR